MSMGPFRERVKFAQDGLQCRQEVVAGERLRKTVISCFKDTSGLTEKTRLFRRRSLRSRFHDRRFGPEERRFRRRDFTSDNRRKRQCLGQHRRCGYLSQHIVHETESSRDCLSGNGCGLGDPSGQRLQKRRSATCQISQRAFLGVGKRQQVANKRQCRLGRPIRRNNRRSDPFSHGGQKGFPTFKRGACQVEYS